MTVHENPNAESENAGEEKQFAPYFIDADIAEASRKSLSLLAASRMCWMCRQGWDDFQVIATNPSELMATIATHCSDQQDYLLPDTPLREAIFRALLAKANAPMTAERISAVLTEKWAMTPFPRDTSPAVIQRLIDSDAYYCIGPASPTEDGVPIKKRRGGKRSATTKKQNDPPKQRVEALAHPDYGDPFQPSATAPAIAADPAMSDRFAKLLYWLSSYGDGTRQTFAQACQTLSVEEEGRGGVGSVIRRLRLLGHLEISDDGSKWAAAPSAFVRFPDGSGNGFLAGLRTQSLLSDARAHDVTSQPDDMGPPRVETTWEDAQNSALDMADSGAVSTELAQLLPSLNAWRDTLPTRNPVVAQYDKTEVWDGAGFIPCVIYEGDGRPSGMYTLTRTVHNREHTQTLFFDQPRGRWLSGDWYGLRFLALQATGFETKAIHVSDTNELLIPDAQRLPMLYERVLVLASGLLPDRAPNRSWLKYNDIPYELARTLCRKLNVQLSEETNGA